MFQLMLKNNRGTGLRDNDAVNLFTESRFPSLEVTIEVDQNTVESDAPVRGPVPMVLMGAEPLSSLVAIISETFVKAEQIKGADTVRQMLLQAKKEVLGRGRVVLENTVLVAIHPVIGSQGRCIGLNVLDIVTTFFFRIDILHRQQQGRLLKAHR